ncbi:Hypothetical protein SRAE_X000059900 [Strongyloides ratti]|uniref:Uncharacterized protein n=1 Tax=Strongyloides ratti TaxID=34506 RepID=A0A090LSU9_STRRB|nr:Hypothetical protein SRAE_X000059900 [Strongyloides ratti]CEF71272.1 Hypothetical protein SRAE_X000059900 [Strongyloides ratti]
MVAKPNTTLTITSYFYDYLKNKRYEENQNNQEYFGNNNGTHRLRHEYEYLERCNRECCAERSKIMQQNTENYYGKLKRKDVTDDNNTKQT